MSGERNVQPRPEGWRLPGARFGLRAASAALVLVDLQYGMAKPGHGIVAAADRAASGTGGYYFERLEGTVLPALQRVLGAFRSRRLRVVHVHYASMEPDGSDLLPLIRERNEQRQREVGSLSVYPIDHPESRPLEEVAPLEGERVMVKTSASAFTSTALDRLLRNWDIGDLVVGGVLTSGCVDLTARDAADRGYRVVLLEDGCATWKEASHRATLEVFAGMFGRVATADEVIAELGPDREEP